MTLRLKVDRAVCAGHGLCYGAAPQILASDEQGDPVVLVDPVPPERLGLAEGIVDACPERALRLEP